MYIKDKLISRINSIIKEHSITEEQINASFTKNKAELEKDRFQRLQIGNLALKSSVLVANFKLLCDILKEDMGEDLIQVLDSEGFKMYNKVNEAMDSLKNIDPNITEQFKKFVNSGGTKMDNK